ncbi:hypothetical protein IPA_09085 [Ignicoccus pacificus DSM 13166]|uniref:ArnR1-like winged helix-turn-helix domain-containing protein n=1 Tax=Ignicoccus pacificus DSM 13166 TaxID=940294 RepID=A0A977KBX3_9CREN|nr:hypothetical protein IPA_09085 [Ignicoccus pacificus DSM 13166]
MLSRKEVEVIKALAEGPLKPKELYAKLGAHTEGQQANLRKVIKRLRDKGLIMKIPKSNLYVLTGKGMRILECIRILEE